MLRGHRLTLLAVLWVMCSGSSTLRAQSLTWKDTSKVVPVDRNFSFATDPRGSWTLESMQAGEGAQQFRPAAEDIEVFKQREGAVWARFTIANTGAGPFRGVIYFAFPHFESLEFFQPDGTGMVIHEKLGLSYPFGERMEPHRTPAFPIEIAPGGEQTYYFRSASPNLGNHIFEAKVFSRDEFDQQKSRESIVLSIIFSILGIMMIYNLLLGLTIRDRSYLFYVLFLGAAFMALFTATGLSFRLLWPNYPQVTNEGIMPQFALAMITALLFGKTFLNTKAIAPKLTRGIEVLMALLALISVFAIFGRSDLAVDVLFPVMALSSVSLIASGIIAMRRKYRPARFYLLAHTALLTALFIFALETSKVIPSTPTGSVLPFFGICAEVILLSIGLADRINILKAERERAQVQALQSQNSLRHALEVLLDGTKALATTKELLAAVGLTTRSIMKNTLLGRNAQADFWFTDGRNFLTSENLHCVRILENGSMLKKDRLDIVMKPASTLEKDVKRLAADSVPYVNAEGCLIMPVFTGSELIGVLALSPYTNRALSSEDSHFIRTLGSSLSISLENIRFVEQTELNARAEAELDAARLVQETLLPHHLEFPGVEVVGHSEPAEKTGGDWYSCFYDPRSLTLYAFIGDVTGHGISSALVTGVVCGAIQSFMKSLLCRDVQPSREESLQEIAKVVNEIVCETGSRSERLMTMWFLALDVVTGKVAYINAGHTHPVWIHANGTSVPFHTAPRLGHSPDSIYTAKEADLAVGDTLFLYTDGLLENCAPQGKGLNFKALGKLMSHGEPLKDMRDRLLKESRKRLQDTKPEDDSCFVILRWKGPMLADSPPGFPGSGRVVGLD